MNGVIHALHHRRRHVGRGLFRHYTRRSFGYRLTYKDQHQRKDRIFKPRKEHGGTPKVKHRVLNLQHDEDLSISLTIRNA